MDEQPISETIRFDEKITTTGAVFIKPPEYSNWQCYMFGNRLGRIGMIYRPTSNIQTPTSTSVATTDTKATSEPDRPTDQPSDAERATIEAIAEIVAQGDRNTIALNACVDSYNDVRNLLNDKR